MLRAEMSTEAIAMAIGLQYREGENQDQRRLNRDLKGSN